MKNLKKLNSAGFAHWVIPALVILAIGGIGTYLLTASHADSIASAQSICGPGYRLIKQKAMPSSMGATVYLTVNKSAKKFCSVTQSTGSKYGQPRFMHDDIWISSQATSKIYIDHVDQGAYKAYAGPVYASYANYNSAKYNVGMTGIVGSTGSGTTLMYSVPNALNMAQ